MNVVMTADGRLVEVQATAEREPFTRDELDGMLDLAGGGIEEIVAAQDDAVAVQRALISRRTGGAAAARCSPRALGGAIGLERELRDHEAGFRTHLLVSLGSCALHARLRLRLDGLDVLEPTGVVFDPTRIAAQIVTGIGFLGAGAIIVRGINVRGLTTAATLWVVAAIGMAAGTGYYAVAIGAAALVLVSLWPAQARQRTLHLARAAGGGRARDRARAGGRRVRCVLAADRGAAAVGESARSSSGTTARMDVVLRASRRSESARVAEHRREARGCRARAVAPVRAVLALGERAQAGGAAGGAARLGDRAARRRRVPGRGRRDVLRERTRQGAVRARGRGRGRVGPRRGLRDRGGRARRPARESSPRAGPRTASRSFCAELDGAADRRARYVCELVALAPDGQRATGHRASSTGRSRPSAAAPRASATTRSSSRPARRAPSPSSATPGSASTLTAPAPPRPSVPALQRKLTRDAIVALTRLAPAHARPAISSSSRRPCHQLISAPKTITFAIT